MSADFLTLRGQACRAEGKGMPVGVTPANRRDILPAGKNFPVSAHLRAAVKIKGWLKRGPIYPEAKGRAWEKAAN